MIWEQQSLSPHQHTGTAATTMTAPSLMTLPSEIRLLICKLSLPAETEFVVPGCYETGERATWKYIPLPSNPRLPLMLINKQVWQEVATLPRTILIARIHDWMHLDEWLDKSTLRDRSLVSKVHVDTQCLRGLLSDSLSRREDSAEWHVRAVLGESLVRYYECVEPLIWELTVSLFRLYVGLTRRDCLACPNIDKIIDEVARWMVGCHIRSWRGEAGKTVGNSWLPQRQSAIAQWGQGTMDGNRSEACAWEPLGYFRNGLQIASFSLKLEGRLGGRWYEIVSFQSFVSRSGDVEWAAVSRICSIDT